MYNHGAPMWVVPEVKSTSSWNKRKEESSIKVWHVLMALHSSSNVSYVQHRVPHQYYSSISPVLLGYSSVSVSVQAQLSTSHNWNRWDILWSKDYAGLLKYFEHWQLTNIPIDKLIVWWCSWALSKTNFSTTVCLFPSYK